MGVVHGFALVAPALRWFEKKVVVAMRFWGSRNKERLPDWRQCPGCNYNIVTGGGRRSCNWYDCPYLPEELKVQCPRCNFNFATGDGSPECGDPPSCEWAESGYAYAANAREFVHKRSRLR